MDEMLSEIFSRKPIKNPWEGMCFGCSMHNDHGLKLKFWKFQEICYSKFTIPPYMCGFEGIVHGGIIALLLDEISAWTIGVNKHKMGFTLKSTIEYLKVVPVNVEVILRGRIIEENGDILTIESEILLENKILAKCTSVWKIPDLNLMAKLTGVEYEKLKGMVSQLVDTVKTYEG
jgi:acyl-coenzyme A thioesterase PaaI-like protein